MKKREEEYLNAFIVAYYWNLYFKYKESPVFSERKKSAKGWQSFRKSGIRFVHNNGTEKARYWLGFFLEGALSNKRGPIHYLLQDR